MVDRFALQLQSLGRAADRVLVAADLAARRSDDSRFTTRDVTDVFYALNIPPPGNVSAAIGTLKQEQKLVLHPDRRYALTPVGVRAIVALSLDSGEEVEAKSHDRAQAEFAHTDHTVIPSWAAPPRWAAGIARLLDRAPFDTNVFCMTRFPSEGGLSDPVAAAISTAREALVDFGLTLHLATDAIVEDDLLGNVGAYMWACRYGLSIIEDRVGRGLNYNALIELGGMIVTGRRCTILKDSTAPTLPVDLAGQIARPVDLDVAETVDVAVRGWAGHDLGLPDR